MEAAGCEGNAGKFLSHISEYGAESGGGCDHTTIPDNPSRAAPFLTSFFRAYDMSDNAVEVLRRDYIAIRHHVDVSSARFRVDLPVTACIGNPVTGANQVAQAIFGGMA